MQESCYVAASLSKVELHNKQVEQGRRVRVETLHSLWGKNVSIGTMGMEVANQPNMCRLHVFFLLKNRSCCNEDFILGSVIL